MQFDAVVIGGGMAGVVAACAAASEGRRICLVRRGYGATAMSSGAIDVCGSDAAMEGGARHFTQAEMLASFAKNRPGSPYAAVGQAVSRLGEAFEFVRKSLRDVAITQPDIENPPLRLPTDAGTLKQAASCQDTMLRMDGRIEDGLIGVLDFPGLSGYRGVLLAQLLDKLAGRDAGGRFAFMAVPVRYFRRHSDAFMNSFSAASSLEEEASHAKFASAVAEATGAERFSALLSPAILGIGKSPLIIEKLWSATGVRVFEMLATRDSVPGLRLQRALDAWLDRSGVRLIEGRAAGFESEGRLLRTVGVEMHGGGRESLEAGRFVLASGRFIGGGISRDRQVSETVFGLPVASGRDAIREQDFEAVTSPSPADRQKLFSAGLRVDGSLAPLDEDGRPAFENLLAAGSVIGGYDFASDKCGLGACILTGYLAGRAAAGVER